MLTHEGTENLRVAVEDSGNTSQFGRKLVAGVDEPLASWNLRAQVGTLKTIGVTVNGEWTITDIICHGAKLHVWIRETIGEDNGGQVDLLDLGLGCGSQGKVLVGLVHDVGNVRRVRSSITLRGNMERKFGVFWEAVQEELEESVDVFSSHGAGVNVGVAVRIRVTNVDRLVEEDDVGMGVPTVFVVRRVATVLANSTRSKLKEKSRCRATTRTAVQPKNKRRFLGRIACFKEPGQDIEERYDEMNESTDQKKRCLSSAISRYPEYCLTDGSQRSGSVNRS